MRCIGVTSVVLAVSCSGDDGGTVETTIATTTTLAPAPRVDDGILRIGALVPLDDAAISASLQTALESSVEAINAAGGVLGRDVELVVADEGTTGASAASAVESLVGPETAVDAVIGPASSTTAVAALDEAIEARVVACSATATGAALDGFPDDGLFFRSIPSDTLQAVAIAERAERTGANTAFVVHVDDAYGRRYATAVGDALDGREIELIGVAAIGVGQTELAPIVDEVTDAGAQVVIVLGAAGDVTRVLAAFADDPTTPTRFVVNDTVRDAAAHPALASLPASLRSRVVGVGPALVERDEEGTAVGRPFAQQVEDCVNLIALAAVQARSDAPASIASQMPSVSTGGSSCRTFELCAERIEQGLQINYNGRTGLAELGRTGETARASFELFRIAPDGSDVYVESFVVAS